MRALISALPAACHQHASRQRRKDNHALDQALPLERQLREKDDVLELSDYLSNEGV